MTEQPPVLYCANHPSVETTLRCNRCEKPICVKCAVLTPTGYRCKECVRGQQKIFETSQTLDYPIAFGIAALLAFLGSLLLPQWLLLAIIGSPIAGTVIAEAVRLAVRRRRSKRLFQVVLMAVIAGCLPALVYHLAITGIVLFQYGFQGATSLVPLISAGIYTALVTSTAYYRFSGLSIGM